MEALLSAVIGGLFSLAGIWLKHYLETRSNPRESAPSDRPEKPSRSDLPSARAKGPTRLATGAVLLGVVVAIFLILQLDIPDSVGWVLFFAGGACLVYGLFLVGSSLRSQ